MRARDPARKAFHIAAMAYFDNINAILKSGSRFSKDGYGEWQEKMLSKVYFGSTQDYKSIMERFKQALQKASAREVEFQEKVQKEFDERMKKDKELREKIPK